ncbi:DUF1707 SHOCT-like domain-containing protein [Actinomadura scrupuli]|uniref:DUF1707 SHOCT-like domain-containing protein n=1 Tax=Actinomadura scrupuli TaxID=559629 RepID=UPI003D97B779
MDVEQGNAPVIRASDRERDAALQRLQVAFGEGRLTDEEFDERMRAALAARTHRDLDVLFTDLPADAGTDAAAASRTAPPVAGRPVGRFQVAYKNSVRRGGRWRVPERYSALIYKGHCRLDLRAAELDGPVTTIFVVAYKSDVEIIVPPGVRVELSGFGASAEVHTDPAPNAPTVVVRGFAYKGSVDTRTSPSESR